MADINLLSDKKRKDGEREPKDFPIEYHYPMKEASSKVNSSVPPAPSASSASPALPTASQRHRFYRSRHTPKQENPLHEEVKSRVEVNLIRKKISEKGHAPWFGLKQAIALAFSMVALVYIFLVLYQAYQAFSAKDVKQDIQLLDQKIQSYGAFQEKAKSFSEEIVSIESAWKQRISWAPFFQYLEASTLPETKYTDMFGNSTGVVSLEAETSSYTLLSEQLEILKHASFVETAEVKNVVQEVTSEGNTLVNYEISLKLKNNVLTESY